MPPAYRSDGHGGVELQPGFAQTHPQGPFDFGGMAREIDWPGVAKDFAGLAGDVATSILLPIPEWFDLLHTGKETWDAQKEANTKSDAPPSSGSTDRATNGVP
jgi:hypothetical protein